VTSAWRRYVRLQDFVWLLFLTALAVFSPDRDAIIFSLLIALGLVQVFESRLKPVTSVVMKLALCYPLIDHGGRIQSSFYLSLVLPVITAATSFGLVGTTVTTLAAGVMYLSFLLRLSTDQYIPTEEYPELVLRVSFLTVIGFLTNQLAAANREKAHELQITAEQLAEANRS